MAMRHTGIGEFIDGVPAIMHVCERDDVIYANAGVTPPCKRMQGEPRQ